MMWAQVLKGSINWAKYTNWAQKIVGLYYFLNQILFGLNLADSDRVQIPDPTWTHGPGQPARPGPKYIFPN